MSILDSLSSSQQQSSSTSEFDHQISLIDSTRRAQETKPTSTSTSSTVSSPSASREPSLKGLTGPSGRKSTLREEIARRKYSKWQESKILEDSGHDGNNPTIQGDSGELGSGEVTEFFPAQDATPFSKSRSRKNAKTGKKRLSLDVSGESSEIDILYENQRGSFFCGIPLYSHRSLLNFDPSPWVNVSFKDSPVDITNAQVPDPTWEWAWKSWYVDMSADVDEEGWQYSFSFQPAFSWHGAHVWFHAFVRRRRWLRKRVKKAKSHIQDERGASRSMREGLLFNADYFTIHTGRDRSTDSSVDTRTLNKYKYPSTDKGDDISEIRDIRALMTVLQKARIDRERVEAIEDFVSHGGEDILYLEERMSEIMSSFIFQNSRRQILAYLLATINAASEHRDEHKERDEPEEEQERRKIDNLLNAVKAAEREVKRLEYWSDVKDVAHTGESAVIHEEGRQRDPLSHQFRSSSLGSEDPPDAGKTLGSSRKGKAK